MTKRNQLFHDNSFAQVLAPAVYNSDQLCSEIDMKGYHDLAVVVNMGNSADTLSGSVYIYLELQDSADGITYAACADADISNPITGAVTGTFALIDAPSEDTTLFKTSYKGTKRYLKVNVNFVGTHTTGTPVSVTAIKGSADFKPVNA